EDQRANFSDLGVDFDIWHGESDVADMLEPLVERLRESGVAEGSEGALIVRVDEPGDKKEIPPLILVNRAGGYLYSTTDVATIWYRSEQLGADLALSVVAALQPVHPTQVFRDARRASVAGRVPMEYVAFGSINGTDGKQFKK